MVDIIKETNEVYYLNDPKPTLKKSDFPALLDFAKLSLRKRARYCAHKNKDSQLHDMFEIFTNQTYMHPLKQISKTYSFHIIAGEADVYLFSDTGDILDCISLGDFQSGKQFYFRPPENVYRTLVTKTEYVLYHEATTGPFNKGDTLFAPWAPTETDAQGIQLFLSELRRHHSTCE